MKKVKYQRSPEGEQRRIASIPKGNQHWNWSEKPNLLTLHKRIHRKHGKASVHKCECGEQARDWALVGDDYTDKVSDYKPMCRKCHVRLDKGYLKRPKPIIIR